MLDAETIEQTQGVLDLAQNHPIATVGGIAVGVWILIQSVKAFSSQSDRHYQLLEEYWKKKEQRDIDAERRQIDYMARDLEIKRAMLDKLNRGLDQKKG